MSEKLENLMSSSLEKIKEIINANMIIGESISTGDGTTIIPVSKISYGFASGGSDFSTKTSNDMFGGGNGAGVNIVPVAFLVISNGDVKLLQVESFNTILDRIVATAPETVEKIINIIKNRKKENCQK